MPQKIAIIETALRLFFSKGYENTSLNDIADILDITKPALYYHFKNKDEIFEEAVNFYLQHVGEYFITSIDTAHDIKQVLEATFCHFDDMIKHLTAMFDSDVAETFRNNYFFIFDAFKRYPHSQVIMKEIYTKTIDHYKNKLQSAQVKGDIRDDVDCATIAFEITALAEGIMFMKIADPALDLSAIGKSIFENYWLRLK